MVSKSKKAAVAVAIPPSHVPEDKVAVNIAEPQQEAAPVKKRASKKTALAPIDVDTSTATPSTSTSTKKAKKQIQVVATVTPNGIEGTFKSAEPRRSLIAHLHIHSNEVQFSDIQTVYDPTPPKQVEPYDILADDSFIYNRHAPFENDTDVNAVNVKMT